ncbi:O-antigen ligase family protein [Myroides phaeus]|uniref:O-antigen ligase family protein n=1 Tax=Myroides phaeus TaxID=702745 RepID=UPI0013038414|nr:O-antigen ligase family protein [Myroides phaeus]
MIEKKIVLIATAFFCFLMPISTKLANIGIILFIISMVWYIIKLKLYKEVSVHKIRGLFLNTTAVIVLLLAIGLFYTIDFSRGIKYFENYSSYLILPLLLSFVNIDLLTKIKKVAFRFFVFGSVVSSLILLGNNFIKYYLYKGRFVIETDLLGYFFTYHEFAHLLKFHPTLLGLYLVFSIIIINEFLDFILHKFKYIFFLILFLCLVFLNSRTPFLVFALYLLFCFCRLIKNNLNNRKGRLRILFAIVGLMILSVGLFFTIRKTYIYERFSSHLVWELTENKGTSYDGIYSNDSRISRWKALFNKGLERPILGFGSGSEDTIVLQAYAENDLVYAFKSKYGSHNQYLVFFLEYGILGLLLFLHFIFVQFKYSFRAKNTISFLLNGIVLIACIFDSILYLNTYIIFVALFLNLFYFENKLKIKEYKV